MAISFPAVGAVSATNGGSNPTPGIPAGMTAGDCMVCFCYSDESTDGSHTMPAGWDQIFQSAATSSGTMSAWFRAWQSGDAAPTVTLVNHVGGTSGNTAIANIIGVRGADDASVAAFIHQLGARTVTGSNQDVFVTTGSPSVDDGEAGFVFGGKADDWTSVATLSGNSLTWAEQVEQDSTSGADAGLVVDSFINASGSAQTLTDKQFAVTGGVGANGIGGWFIIEPAPVVTIVEGAATLSGSGALNASALVQVRGAAALSGAGALNAAGMVQVQGAAALSGAGALSAAAMVQVQAAATLTGVGDLVASGDAFPPGVPIVEGAATLTGSGALAAAALVEVQGAAALSGAGALSAAALVQVQGAAALSGAGVLAASGLVQVQGAATLTGVGTLAAAAEVFDPLAGPPEPFNLTTRILHASQLETTIGTADNLVTSVATAAHCDLTIGLAP